jgi:hypothetical protein
MGWTPPTGCMGLLLAVALALLCLGTAVLATGMLLALADETVSTPAK